MIARTTVAIILTVFVFWPWLLHGLDLIWDIADAPRAKFVGVRFDKDAYGLVESGLLERFLAGEK